MQCGKWTRAARALPLLMGFLLLVGALQPAEAGTGARRADDKSLLDITVYFDFEPDDEELSQWRTTFTKFSAALYDASEAQLRLGRVRFTTCQSEKSGADIWIHEDHDLGARTAGRCCGLGQNDFWIHLYRVHQCPGDDAFLEYPYLQDDADPMNPCVALGRRQIMGTCASRDQSVGTCDSAGAAVSDEDLMAKSGPFGMLHEAGHYLFGLQDEYEGERTRVGVSGKTFAARGPYIYCSEGEGCTTHEAAGQLGVHTHFASVMDGGTTKIGRNRRTEFCYSGSVDAFRHKKLEKVYGLKQVLQNGAIRTVVDKVYEFATNQEAQNCGSCWDTLIGRRCPAPGQQVGILLDHNFKHRLVLDPILGPPQPQGPPPTDPVFEFTRGTPGFVLMIDTSRSMMDLMPGGRTRLEAAVEGAQQMLDTVRPTERIGVIAFNSEVHPYAPPGEPVLQLATPERVQALKTYVAGLGAERNTATGMALESARDAFQTLDAAECSARSVLLLSDGRSTVGVAPLEVARSFSGIQIYTLGLGETADEETLQSLADETFGDFVSVRRSGQLGAVLSGLLSAARGEEGVLREDGVLLPGEDETFTLNVPDSLREVTFSLESEAGALLSWEILDPDGVAVAEPGDGAGERLDRREPQPRAGVWTVRIGNAGATDAIFHLLVTADAPKLAIATSIGSGGSIPFTEPLPIVATVVASGGPITGATVTARISTQDGLLETIPLWDDGDPSHGDVVAKDGRYSALFSKYAPARVDGSAVAYQVDVSVVGECGQISFADGGTNEDGPLSGSTPYIASFTGYAAASVVVTDVPAAIEAGAAVFSASGDTPIVRLRVSEADVTPIMPFTLVLSGEGMTLSEVSVTSVGTGDETTVDEMGLYLDGNADGLPDNRHRPLARTRFNQGDGRATFRVPSGFLATLPGGGAETHFVIGFSSRLGKQTFVEPDPIGGGVGPLGSGGAGIPLVPTPGTFSLLGLSLLAALSALAVGAVRARRRTWGHMAVCSSAALVFLALVAGSGGCGSRTRIITEVNEKLIEKVDPGSYALVLDPADVRLVGSTSGAAIAPTGLAFAQVVIVEPDPPEDE
jgi:hypothetical protein